MEAFLRGLLPRLIPVECGSEIHAFQGKTDLLGKLEARLRGYAQWLPNDWRLFVIVDRDDDDCGELKANLEAMAQRAGLATRSSAGDAQWQVVNRIIVEELEAWYFGDWSAVKEEYPRVSRDVPQRRGLREPDAILGGRGRRLSESCRITGTSRRACPRSILHAVLLPA